MKGGVRSRPPRSQLYSPGHGVLHTVKGPNPNNNSRLVREPATMVWIALVQPSDFTTLRLPATKIRLKMKAQDRCGSVYQ